MLFRSYLGHVKIDVAVCQMRFIFKNLVRLHIYRLQSNFHVRPSRIRDMLFEPLKLVFLLKALLKTGPQNLDILGGYLKQILLFYTHVLTYAQA